MKAKTLSERIVESELYRSGDKFTSTQMRSYLGHKDSAQSITFALNTLCEDGLSVKIPGRAGTNLYTKHSKLAIEWMRKPWVSTPTSDEFTPKYC